MGGALVIHGEAGVGKSVLLRELRESAGRFQVLWTTGIQGEMELSFAAAADLLGPLEEGIDDLPDPQASALRGALRVAEEQVADRFAVYAAMRSLLGQASRNRPLLVLVDDAHWIDASSREALLFCARRADEAAVALIFAVRDGAGNELAVDGLPRLRLEGLDEEAAVELAARAAPGIDSGVARALHGHTGGNPLAIVELASELSPDQAGGREPLPAVPEIGPRLRAVFEERLNRLPEATRRALVVAAASETGRLDTIRAAMSSTGLDQESLAPAEELGVIDITGGVLAWRHPLVRSAAYHAVAPAERRSAHAALADAAHGDSLDDHRAWHLAAAADAPDESVAAELERVAERATQRGGTAVVARALETAARLTPGDEKRGRRFIAAASAAIATADSARAGALLDAAQRHTGNPRLHAQIERLRARMELMGGSPQAAHDRLVRAAAPWESQDPALAAEMLTEAVEAHMAQGKRDDYLRTAGRAFAVGRRAGSDWEALPGVVYAMGLIGVGESAEGVELLDRYSSVAEIPEVWTIGPELVGMVALTWIWLERFDDAERLLTAVVEAARESGAARVLCLPLAVLGELNHRLGRWATARRMVAESVRHAEDVGQGALLANNVCYLARVEASLGNGEAARSNAERGLALCRAQGLGAIEPHARYALGLLALSRGEYEVAARELNDITLLNDFAHEPGLMIWEPDFIEAQLLVGKRDKAKAALRLFEEDVQKTGRPRGRAVLARLRGMFGGDESLDAEFGTALELHKQTQCPFEEARTQLAYGERLRRARRRADARVQLSPALATFEELGARLFADRARGELQAAGARARSAANGDSLSELTAAERRVVDVIVGGATYDEAASALFLSPRTIETHLRQAYRKLGVRSRSELATLVSNR